MAGLRLLTLGHGRPPAEGGPERENIPYTYPDCSEYDKKKYRFPYI